MALRLNSGIRDIYMTVYTTEQDKGIALMSSESVSIYLITNTLKNVLAKDTRHVYMLLKSVFLKRELLVWQLVNINNFKTLVQIPNKCIKLSS